MQPLSPLSRSHSWNEGAEEEPQSPPLPSVPKEEPVPEVEEEEEKESVVSDSKSKPGIPEPLELKKQRLDSLSSADDGQVHAG